MNARDRLAHILIREFGTAASTDGAHEAATDAVIAAIRAMSVEDQAELIRGTVDHLAGLVRVQGDWRKP